MKTRILFLFVVLSFLIIGCNKNKFDSVKYFIESDNIDEAELILQNMSKREKNSFDYNYLNGIVLVKKNVAGYKRDALNSFLRANKFNPNNYMNNLMISKMFIEVNNLSNAEIFAIHAEKLYSKDVINTYKDDVYYLLAEIYLNKKAYKAAFENLSLSSFQNNENIIFLKTEIEDLKDGTNLLDDLIEDYKKNNLLSDEMYFNYLHYLFLNKRIKDADVIADDFLKGESLKLKYYGCLFKAFINMLNGNFKIAQSFIDKSYDYVVVDSLFLRYKMKFFYTYLTEKNLIKIFNSFLIYKFFYEKNDQETITAKEDLTEIFEYLKDDVYFNLLK